MKAVLPFAMPFAIAVALLCALLWTPLRAEADADVDMDKITCQAFLDKKREDAAVMLTWLDGYMSAINDNKVMSAAWTEKLRKHVNTYCARHTDKTLLDAVQDME